MLAAAASIAVGAGLFDAVGSSSDAA